MKAILLILLPFMASANLKSYVRDYLKNSTEIKQASYNFELSKLSLELEDDKRPWTLSLYNEIEDNGLASNPFIPALVNDYDQFTSSAQLTKEFQWGGEFSIGGSYADFDGTSGTYEGYNQELKYSQSLGDNFLGRNDKLDEAIAQKNVDSEKFSFDAKTSTNVLELINIYYDFKKTKTLFELKKEAKKRAVKRYQFVKKQVRDGLKERVDLYQAESSLNFESESYAELRASLVSIQKQFESKIEKTDNFNTISTYKIKNLKLRKIETGNIDGNLSLKALSEKLKALSNQVEKFDNSVFPTIELFGAYKTNNYASPDGSVVSDGTFGSDNSGTDIGLSIVIPLGFNAQENSLKKAKIDRLNVEYQERLAKIRTKNELDTLLNTISLIDETIGLVVKRHELAKKEVKEYNRLYSRGRADLDNVISAEERLINTENKYVEYVSRRQKLYFSLLDIYGQLEGYFN